MAGHVGAYMLISPPMFSVILDTASHCGCNWVSEVTIWAVVMGSTKSYSVSCWASVNWRVC